MDEYRVRIEQLENQLNSCSMGRLFIARSGVFIVVVLLWYCSLIFDFFLLLTGFVLMD